MNTDNMNEGVQLLVKRMESNPEEFSTEDGNQGKWGRLLDKAQTAPWITEQEKSYLKAQLYELDRDLFTAHVLARLTVAWDVPRAIKTYT